MALCSRRTALKAAAAAPALMLATAHARSKWTPPPERAVKTIEHVWIAMGDGARLSVRLWLPEGGAPAPAVLEYLPYRKRDSYRFHDDVWGQALASRGIAYARVDVRGTGDSEGVITDEYSEVELADGEACIAWLARQPWCTGAVGMRGISWGGINTVMIAARRPAALRAIMPMSFCDNRLTEDAHYIGGALGRTNFQWGTLFKTVMAAPPDPEIVGAAWEAMWRARLEATAPILHTWLSHQRLDDYWRRGSVGLEPSSIQIPAYLVAGWQEPYARPVLRLFEALKGPRKCVIGPWGHTYPWLAEPQALDWASEELRWWRHWLCGEDTGIMDDPMLQVFMNDAPPSQTLPGPTPGRWIAERVWPRPAAPLNLHLRADGALAPEPGPAEERTHAGGAVIGLAKPEWIDRPPVEQSRDDARSLTFETAPLDRDVEILGAPRLTVRVRASRPTAQLAARLTQLAPDGGSWLVSWGLVNLTHRDGHAAPAPLTPGHDYDVVLDLMPIAHRFAIGTRLRLALSDGLWPLAWPAPEPADLTFALGPTATLALPEHTPSPAAATLEERPAPPQADAPAPAPAPGPIAAGRYRIVHETPPHPRLVAATGATLSHSAWEVSEINDGDPSSCRWTQRIVSSWSRGAWTCEVEARYALYADAANFHLSETLIARRDGADVFERHAESSIPRGLI
jgi:putative CocE/NonD family hydrolase